MGAPQNCYIGSLRLLGVPQIAETLQISGSPSKLLEPLRLLGAPQIAGYFPMYSGSSGGDEILVSYIDLVFCNRLIGTNAINTCTFWIVKFVIVS